MGGFFNVDGTSIVDSSEILYVRSVNADVLSFASFGSGGFGTNKSAGYGAFGNSALPPLVPYNLHAIQKVSFSNDATSTYITAPSNTGRTNAGGVGSQTDGFVTGGYQGPPTSNPHVQTGLKYPFAGSTISTVPEILINARYLHASCQSMDHGFNVGGLPYFPGPGAGATTAIDKFPFASTHTAAAFSSLATFSPTNVPTGLSRHAGASSITHGYVAAGNVTPPFTQQSSIYKFPFTNSNVTAYNVASLVTVKSDLAGVPNGEFAYFGGGKIAPFGTFTAVNDLEKFSMITEANASDIGNLADARIYLTPHSSTTHGYFSGGSSQHDPGNVYGSASNRVDKFPFSSDGNTSDVADLVSNQAAAAGTQG